MHRELRIGPPPSDRLVRDVFVHLVLPPHWGSHYENTDHFLRAYLTLGDKRQALDFYEQALPLNGRSATAEERALRAIIWPWFSSAWANWPGPRLELEIVVALDAAIDTRDLVSDRAALERVRSKAAGKR